MTEIGDVAFIACYSLTNIKIPKSVTKIGDGAFFACTRLKNITIPKETQIGEKAFCECYCSIKEMEENYDIESEKNIGKSDISKSESIVEYKTNFFYRFTQKIKNFFINQENRMSCSKIKNRTRDDSVLFEDKNRMKQNRPFLFENRFVPLDS